MVNVRDYGVNGDVVRITDAAIAASSTTLSSAGTPFTAGHVGMRVQVVGAGVAYNDRGAWSAANTYAAYDLTTYGGTTYVASAAIAARSTFAVEAWSTNPATSKTLYATILSVSAGNATLDTAASTTVTGATCVYGTDDTDALIALGAGDFSFPAGTYFVADWYLPSNTTVTFATGVTFKIPYYKTTNVSCIRLMTTTAQTYYLSNASLYGDLTIDMSEMTVPNTSTIPRGVHIQNFEDWYIESLHGVGLPGGTGNVLQVGSSSSLAAARRGQVDLVDNADVRGLGSSCIQHTLGNSCTYGRLTCDGGAALRLELDNNTGQAEDIYCEYAYANADSGFPKAAVVCAAHDNVLRDVVVAEVVAAGGADGFVPSYQSGSVENVKILKMTVTGGGAGVAISGNDFQFPGCEVHDASVVGASLTSLHSMSGYLAGTGFALAPGMSYVNPSATLCEGRGFYDIFSTTGVVEGSEVEISGIHSVSNTGPGVEIRYLEQVNIYDGDAGDVPAYDTPSNAQMFAANQYQGTLAGWSAAAGASSVAGSSGVLTVTADGTRTDAVGRTALAASGIPVTANHHYKIVADASLGTAPSGAHAQVTLWFTKSDGSDATNGIQNGSTLAAITTGSTHVAFSFTAPADAAYVTAVVKFFSNVAGQTLTSGWTMTFANLALQELVGIATQTYGVVAATGTTVDLYGVDTSYNGTAATSGLGTINVHALTEIPFALDDAPVGYLLATPLSSATRTATAATRGSLTATPLSPASLTATPLIPTSL